MEKFIEGEGITCEGVEIPCGLYGAIHGCLDRSLLNPTLVLWMGWRG